MRISKTSSKNSRKNSTLFSVLPCGRGFPSTACHNTDNPLSVSFMPSLPGRPTFPIVLTSRRCLHCLQAVGVGDHHALYILNYITACFHQHAVRHAAQYFPGLCGTVGQRYRLRQPMAGTIFCPFSSCSLLSARIYAAGDLVPL